MEMIIYPPSSLTCPITLLLPTISCSNSYIFLAFHLHLVISNPVVIRLKRNEESLDNIKQYFVHCKGEEGKSEALSNLYGVLTIGQAIVFCHVRRTCDE